MWPHLPHTERYSKADFGDLTEIWIRLMLTAHSIGGTYA
jgi:hypothetical protein